MKKIITTFFCSLILFSCNSNSYPKAENAFDAGREFIDGCLKGDFDKADHYMLKDDANTQQLDRLKADRKSKSSDDQMQYKQASIEIMDEETLSDSVHIIHYKNSFDKIARKVKVVQRNGDWLVDLKYTFDGNL